jgi:hypothetical protein
MSNATETKAVFTVGQKLSDRSICNYDCIFRGTVIKRTAKRVTLDLGRGEIKTVGIFIDTNGHEACFPFGRYSMASIFSSGDKYIPEPEKVEVVEVQEPSNIIQFNAA